MKCMTYSSKYETILNILLLYLVERSLDFIRVLGEARLFLSGGGGKLDFLRQRESIYFCNHRKCFYNWY